MKRNSTRRKNSRDASWRLAAPPVPLQTEAESPVKRESAGTAKEGSDICVGKSRHMCRSISSIVLLLREIFPAKPDLEIALRANVTQRTAERWLAGDNTLTAESLVALLRSDVGGDLLKALMADAVAPWWRDFSRHLEVARLARHHAETGRRIARIIAGAEE